MLKEHYDICSTTIWDINPILLGGNIPTPPPSYIKQDYSQTGRTFVNPSQVCEQIFLAHILAILFFSKVGHVTQYDVTVKIGHVTKNLKIYFKNSKLRVNDLLQ